MNRKGKNKNREQRTGAFQNSPFASLKGVIARSSQPPAEPQKAASREDQGDGEELFLRSMSGVKQIVPEADREPEKRTAATASQASSTHEDGDRQLFLQALGSIGPAGFRDSPLEEEDDSLARSPSGRLRQLKRGTIRISEELDLHGFMKEEALHRLEHFIESSAARGLQAVLVITGKGTNSPEGPVLPGAVEAWLRSRGKGKVAEFHTAPRDKGGSGAYVVFLKKR